MKKALLILFVAVILFVLFVGCSNDVQESEQDGFTTMFYMDFSTLQAMPNLDELIAGNKTISDKLTVYFIMGGQAYAALNDPFKKLDGGDYKFPDLVKALRNAGFSNDTVNPFDSTRQENVYQYWIFKQGKDGNSEFVPWTPSSKYMSDASTLTNFINYVYSETKNKKTKYILQLWNHGNGSMIGLCSDNTNGLDIAPSMKPKDLHEAIENSNFIKDGKKFEAIIFDMCLMQTIEVLNEVKNYSKCMIASETQQPESGSSYANYFKYLNDNLGANYKEVAQNFIKFAVEKHKKYPLVDDYTWSAIDLTDQSKIDALNKAHIDFIKSAALTKSQNYKPLTDAVKNSADFGRNNSNADIWDIISVAYRLYGTDENSEFIDLKNAIDSVIIYKDCHDSLKTGKDGKAYGCYGLTFTFKEDLGNVITNSVGNYNPTIFDTFCDRVTTYFSKDVADFYRDYKTFSTPAK